MVSRAVQHLALGAGLSAVYVCAGKLGLSMAVLNPSVSPVWPPTGVAIAALLLLGSGYWPAVFLGAFFVNVTNLNGDVPSALGIACGNTLEAILGAVLTRKFARGAAAFDHAPDVVRYVFLAANPACSTSATVGVASLWLAGHTSTGMVAPVWLTWWTANFVSAVVVAPLLVVWLREPRPVLKPGRRLEIASLFLALLGISLLVFGRANWFGGRTYPIGFMTLPPLLWAAFRFRQRGAVAAASLVGAVAVWATLSGTGPFAVPDRNDALLLLQAFIGVNGLTMLILACVVSQNTRNAESLRVNEQRLWMALEAGRMGTWEWDIAAERVRWSPGLEQMHGLAPGTFAGTFQAFLDDVHPEDRDRVAREIADTLKLRRDHHIEYRLLLRDGRVRWVEGRGQILLGADGNPARMVGVCTDVTDRKQAAEERERLLARERGARAESERANKSKDDFLAVLSHELRTPLTPVLLTASLLENDPRLPAALRPDLAAIRRNVEMEARLIDDLLDLTRITRGKLQLLMRPADAHEIVRRAIDISCRDAHARLVVDLAATRHHVRADAGRLQQVFWNLLNNARKFTPPGGTITVRSYNPGDGDASIVIEVTDTGVGIAPEALPKLFTAFEQGDMSKARRTGGLGLGLAISRALVAAHGGMLRASSPGLGKGATFSVQFGTIAPPPSPPPGLEPAVGEGSDVGPTAARRARPPLFKPCRILLVEDDESTRVAMHRLLEAMEHQIIPAGSVAAAIEAVRSQPIDLVISDLGLPDGLGYDLMRTIAEQHGVRRGIALSGYGMPADVQQSRDAGFAEHLTKPVDMDTLQAAITRVVAGEH